MAYLPLANILHYKLRSTFSALGIGIGVCMLVTLSGLARGTLYEVADRWDSVDADLIVFPRGSGTNATTHSGRLWDSYARLIRARHGDIVEQVTPVLLRPMQLAGQDHMAAGVDHRQWRTLTGGRDLSAGRLFDPQDKFARWIERKVLTGGDDQGDEPVVGGQLDLSAAPPDGLELVIDSRLAQAGNFRLNQYIQSANHEWKIVGIVPSGAMARVFMPRRMAQYLFDGSIQQSTLMFVKLKRGVDVGPAAAALRTTTAQDVVLLASYRGMLLERFGILFHYVDAVNVIALVIAFLFIMVTLYTMVLQRTGDIAILKSSGASGWFIVRQVLGESILLTGGGVVMGLVMAFAVAWAVETWAPLHTVTITWQWVGIAILAAGVGAIISALYPARQAMRVDIAEALTLK